jgi:hypothetical protein
MRTEPEEDINGEDDDDNPVSAVVQKAIGVPYDELFNEDGTTKPDDEPVKP